MAKFKRNRSDGSRFLLMPFTVLESQAYLTLTGQQTRLLIDIAHQYKGDNNGRLLAAWTYLNEERGWTSKQTIATALEALISRGLLFKTSTGAPTEQNKLVCRDMAAARPSPRYGRRAAEPGEGRLQGLEATKNTTEFRPPINGHIRTPTAPIIGGQELLCVQLSGLCGQFFTFYVSSFRTPI